MKGIPSPLNGGRFVFASILATLVVLTANLLSSPAADAAVPNGFTDTSVMSVSRPTDIAFTPAGTMLVTSQGGVLYKRSGGTATAILNISSKICSDFERGLLGVTVDPQFVSNSYIYLFYTYNKNGSCAYNQTYSPVNRVSRFVFSGNSVTNETVLIDNVPSPGGNHNAGGMTFGKDGYLYIALGDGGCQIGAPSNCGGSNANARSKHRLLGKVVRVDRDGNAPSSNPYYSTGGTCRLTAVTTSGKHCKETYSWGLRNPFRIADDPNAASTRIFANDVGQNVWEEIDHIQAGKDYGWNVCEGFTYNGGGGTCGFADTNPLYVYGHGSCNSITGGAFIPNGAWPSTYDNTYFFADYTCGTIWTLKESNGTWSRTVFASGLGAVTELEFGPDGANLALYYTNYGSSQIRKISYSAANNRAPIADIDASPTFGELPLEVKFDGRGSTDPDGDDLTYKWVFDNGTTSVSSHPTRTFTEARKYRVTLTVSDGRGGTDTDSVTIDAGNTRPAAIITSPKAENEYYVGQTITLKGYGDDAEDGIIPASRRTWEVLLHHDTHTHPYFGPTTGNNLTFQAPPPEDLHAAGNSYLEIRLTVRDSGGLGKTTSMNIYPNKVDVTVGSNVPGMLVWIEGSPFITPATVVTWENNPLTIVAPDQIGPDDQPYIYQSWSDGGRRTHEYDPPATDSTVTATFNLLPGTSFPAHADARLSEANPDRNEGGGTGLSVKGGTSSDYETVIRFKLTGVGDTVYRARLYLYSYEGTSNGPGIYETSPSWKESTVSWSNRPSPTGGLIDDYGPVAKGSWIAYDVTDAIDGDGYLAFVIRGSSSDAVSWYSRQAGSRQPRLVVWASAPSSSEEPVIETPVAEASPVESPTPIASEAPTEEPTAIAPTETPVPPTEEPTVVEPVPTEPIASPVPYADAFEGDLTSWSADGAALAPGAGRDGGQALRLTATGSDQVAGRPSYVQRSLGAGETDLYLSLALRPLAVDVGGVRVETITDASGAALATLYLLPDGTLALRWGDVDTVTPVAAIDPAAWSRIEMRLQVGSSGTTMTMWVNGAFVASKSTALAPVDLGGLILGGWATDRSYDMLVDDVRIDRTCGGTCPPEPMPEPTVEPPASEETPEAVVSDPGTPASE